MNKKEKILNFLAQPKAQKAKNQIELLAKVAKVGGREAKEIVKTLAKNGDVIYLDGNFVPSDQQGLKKARFTGNEKGFGFCELLCDAGKPRTERKDVFVPAGKQNGVLDGDLVLVKITNSARMEGRIFKVLERKCKVVVGVISIGKNGAEIKVDNNKFSKNVFVAKEDVGIANDGEKVVAQILKYPNFKSPDVVGKVIEVIGQPDDPKTIVLSIVRKNHIFEVFPEEVLKASAKIPQEVTLQQKMNRKDITNETIFTIDGADARDFDDAVSLEKMENGNHMLGVHIADVGEYIKVGSPLDLEAQARGTSSYFPNMVLPMLPKELSNGICSLNEKVERLAISTYMEIDGTGEILSTKIQESVIKSCARLTYSEVFDAICGNPNEKTKPLQEKLVQMNNLAKIMQKRIDRLGSINFELPECQILVDENGFPTEIVKRDRNDAHKLIESFMIANNEAIARLMTKNEIPFSYRIHETPAPERVANLLDFATSIGAKTIKREEEELTPKFFQNMLDLNANESFYDTLSIMTLRTMQKAIYSDKAKGHFGLALKDYCHFTSPIRRYPDLVNHRIIKDFLHKSSKIKSEGLRDFVIEASAKSSDREKNATEAERSVLDALKALFMTKHIGEEFDGKISGVTNFGVYVSLENTIEGMVRVENLPNDEYVFDEKKQTLKGSINTYRIGDRVRIKVMHASPQMQRIDYDMIKKL